MKDISIRIVETLLGDGADSEEVVRVQVVQSLRVLGAKDPEGVLRLCEQWLSARKPSSTSPGHRYVVVRSMVDIMQSNALVGVLPEAFVEKLLQCAIVEMTAINEISSEWALESSKLCVELCELSPKLACKLLIEPIQSSQMPHYFVCHTLSEFALSSPLRFTPFLSEALAKLLPILGLVKQDNHRSIFSTALASFADAVLQLDTKNEELTPRSTPSAGLKRTDFADPFYSALSFLSTDWSRVSEQRVRIPVACALGMLSPLVDEENRITLIPKLIPQVLTALKKEKLKDQSRISKGLAGMFLFCSDAVVMALSPHLEGVLQAVLQHLVAALNDKDQSQPVKDNIGNLLRCIENIAEFNTDAVLTFSSHLLDAKAGNKEPSVRTAVLHILRHLISRKTLEPRLAPFKDTLIATVKLAVQDAEWKVRRALVSTIIAMGASAVPFFAAIGGSDLLLYVIRNAAIPASVVNDFNDPKKKNDALVSPEEVKLMCRNTLTLFSSATQSKLDDVLWPGIMEHFVLHSTEPGLLDVMPTICKCLIQIAARAAETDRFYVDFATEVNLPKPAEIAAKMTVLAMQLHTLGTSDVSVILNAMMAVAPILDEPYLFPEDSEGNRPTPIASLWLAVVPELQQYLASDDHTVADWEEACIKLFTKTAGARQMEDWTTAVTSACIAQFPSFSSGGNAPMARLALIAIGVAISKCTRKDFVSESTTTMMNMADQTSAEHRVGLGRALGYISTNHPDVAVDNLQLLAKAVDKKTSFFASKAEKEKKEFGEIARASGAIGLCHCAKRLPTSIFVSRLDASILPLLSTILTDTKLPEVKDAVMKHLHLLEGPIKKLPSTYTFKTRDALIESILEVIGLGGTSKGAAPAPLPASHLDELTAGCAAITSTINSTPVPQLQQSIVDKITGLAVAFALRPYTGSTPEKEMTACLAVGELLCAVFNNLPQAHVDPILNVLTPVLCKTDEFTRTRALVCYVAVQRACLKRLESAGGAESTVGLDITPARMVGFMVPRVLDPTPDLRRVACDGVVAAVRLFRALNSEVFGAAEHDAAVKELKAIKQRAVAIQKDTKGLWEKDAAVMAKGLCGTLVGVFAEPEHFSPLLDVLLTFGLMDPADESANCSCIVLHGTVRGLGGKLSESAARKYLETMIDVVEKVGSREQSLNGILLSIRNLTKNHYLMTFSSLMKAEVPHKLQIVRSVQSICNDTSLARQYLSHCLDTMLNSPLTEERPDEKDKKKIVKVIAQAPMSACSSIGWMVEVAKGAEVALEFRGSIISCMLLYLTAAHAIGQTESVSIIVAALKAVVLCVTQEKTVDRMEVLGWSTLKDKSTHVAAMAEFLKYLARDELDEVEAVHNIKFDPQTNTLPLPPCEATPLLQEIATFLLPYTHKPIVCHRRTALCVAGAALYNCIGDTQLLQAATNALLSRSGQDEETPLRVQAIHGFCNVVVHEYSHISALVSPLISTLLSSFNDTNAEIVLASMATLLKVVDTVTDKSQISPVAVNIIMRAKTLFESQRPKVRAAALDVYELMLQLANAGLLDDATIDQQIHIHMVTLLVHIEDEDVAVRHSAKRALAQATTFVATHSDTPEIRANIESVFGKPHMQPSNKTKFDEFANEFGALWVTDFSGRVNDMLVSTVNFFGSDKETLRGAAACLAGNILRHLPPEDIGRANVDQTCNALLALTTPSKEKSPVVRERAVRAVGLLSCV